MIIDRLRSAWHRPSGARPQAVCVVAHPDDEALWFAGLILTTPFDWTVICCSVPESDPVRAFKFYDSCDALGAKGKVIPLQEARIGQTIRPSALEILAQDVRRMRPDMILTHNEVGEYGHNQHRDLNEFLTTRYPDITVTGRYGMSEGDYVVDLALEGSAIADKSRAIYAYDHFDAANGGVPKFEVLKRSFATRFDLWCESYVGPQ